MVRRLRARSDVPVATGSAPSLVRGRSLVLAAALAAVAAAASVTPQDRQPDAGVCTVSARCSAHLRLSTGGVVPIFRSGSLAPRPAIERVVVVVHGNRRDADRYFDATIEAVRVEDRLDDVLVLAPNFRTVEDEPGSDEHYWGSQGWKEGNRSRDAARVSSFTVMDELLARVCAPAPAGFPNLRAVVVIGHSAGGQFVQRYAAGGAGCAHPAVDVRYVVMNPSSYLYLDDRRPSTGGGFAPPVPGWCAGYDEYKYGLGDLNRYMRRVGVEQIRHRLRTRRTHYVIGLEDVRRGRSLDRTCEADLQGEHRRERHRHYRDYVRLFAEWTGATFHAVRGVGHDGGQMLMSEIARRLMVRPPPPTTERP